MQGRGTDYSTLHWLLWGKWIQFFLDFLFTKGLQERVYLDNRGVPIYKALVHECLTLPMLWLLFCFLGFLLWCWAVKTSSLPLKDRTHQLQICALIILAWLVEAELWSPTKWRWKYESVNSAHRNISVWEVCDDSLFIEVHRSEGLLCCPGHS